MGMVTYISPRGHKRVDDVVEEVKSKLNELDIKLIELDGKLSEVDDKLIEVDTELDSKLNESDVKLTEVNTRANELTRLIKGKTLTKEEAQTRVTVYLNAAKITDEQAEELMLLIDEVYA